jgi:hypothetical protein
VLIGVCLCPALELAQSLPPLTGTATAVVAELDGIIHPIASEYIDEAISQADATGADVVVIVLRTPGGLLDSTRDIVSRLIASRAPVVVFVGPSGARAASAGFILTIAADVAVMHPARTSERHTRCRARDSPPTRPRRTRPPCTGAIPRCAGVRAGPHNGHSVNLARRTLR